MIKSITKMLLTFMLCLLLVGKAGAGANVDAVENIKTTLIAQEVLVKGNVVDEDGNPIIGATILVKGTTSGTITDIDGNFSISVESPESILVFTFIGYKTQEIVVGSQSFISVSMEPSLDVLDEVVVVGYGETTKRDLTGSVASVSADDLKTTINTSLETALQGRAPGVNVASNTGQPGGGTSIVIRGASGINTSVQPLYVIDGIPFDGSGTGSQPFSDILGEEGGQTAQSPLSGISPDDIENIEILKDASAAAIYGSRAANGVILVTTKSGKKGVGKISYGYYIGNQQLGKTLNTLNLREFAEYNNTHQRARGDNPSGPFASPDLLGEGTDWQKEIFRDALMQNHQLSLSGGNEKTTYAVSGNWFEQDGIVINTGFERQSLRVNIDSDVKDWFKVGVRMNYSNSKQQLTFNETRQGVITGAIRQSPANSVRNLDSTFAGSKGSNPEASPFRNPVAVASILDLEAKRKKTTINSYLEIKPIEGLVWRTEIGGNFELIDNLGFRPKYKFDDGVNQSAASKLIKGNTQSTFSIFKSFATYKRTFNEAHNTSFMIGYEAQESRWNPLSVSILDLISNDTKQIDAGDADSSEGSGFEVTNTLLSYFSRLTYDYKGRYFLTGTIRRDGSSRFGPGNRFGYFPSVAGKWRVSDESFLINSGFIHDLSLRAGWGVIGNQNIDNFVYLSTFKIITNDFGSVLAANRFGNPDVKWEESRSSNLGLDLAILNGDLRLTADFYIKNSVDALLELSPPDSFGTSGEGNIAPPFVNIGQIENKGIELSLSYNKNFTEKLSWSSTLTFSHNKNTVKDLGANPKPILGRVFDGAEVNITRTEVGGPIGAFFGFKTAGVFTNPEELAVKEIRNVDGVDIKITNYPTPKDVGDVKLKGGVFLGDVKFVDVDGNGYIDDNDKTFLGDPNPDFIYGWNNSFNYGNFNLSIYLQGQQGGLIYNFLRRQATLASNQWANQLDDVKEAAKLEWIGDQKINPYDNVNATEANKLSNWKVTNPETDVPRITNDSKNGNSERLQDRFLEDASYLRVKNIKIGYNIPSKVLGKHLESINVYASVSNLFTFTKYTGYDPEIGAFNGNATLTNVDWGRFPISRVWTMGINVNF